MMLFVRRWLPLALGVIPLLASCSDPAPAVPPRDAGGDTPIVGGITCPGSMDAVQGTITTGGVYSGTLYYDPTDTLMSCRSRYTITSCAGVGVAGSATAPEHLWALRPPQSGMVTLSTCGSALIDTILWVGTTPGGTETACNDNALSDCPAGPGGAAKLTFMATAGTTYYVGVEGNGATFDGSYRLNVLMGACPDTNVFSGRTFPTSCGGQCVDAHSDAANCGACGSACPAGQLCWQGTCFGGTCANVMSQIPGSLACGSQCVSPSSDPYHCGGCNNRCPGGSTCVAGACTCPGSTPANPLTLCRAGTTAVCSNLPSDPANCGMCGRACPTGQVCSAGMCAMACATNLTRCGPSCVTLGTSPTNCGACGNVCPAGQTCNSGSCSDVCTGASAGRAVGPMITVGTGQVFGAVGSGRYASPNCGGTGAELTYNWSPPTSGAYRVTVNPPPSSLSVPALPSPVVYVRETDCQGREVACSPSAAATANSNNLVFWGFVGRAYTIFVDTDASLTTMPGYFTLGIEAVTRGPAPTCPGRDLASAVGDRVAEGAMALTASAATGSCGGEGGNEVTFTWTAPSSDQYVISTAGSTFDTVLYVRDGRCPAQTTPPVDIECNDDLFTRHAYGAPRLDSMVGLTATGGRTYTIVLDSFNWSAGRYRLNIRKASGDERVPNLSVPMPATCPESTATLTLTMPVTGTTLGAPSGLIGTCGGRELPERAYAFTATVAGRYQFAITDASFDSLLYVRNGSCSGAELACQDDYGTGARRPSIVVNLTAGQTVAVVVDGGHDYPAWGTFTLAATLAAPTAVMTPPVALPVDPCQTANVPSAPGYVCDTAGTSYRQCDRRTSAPAVVTTACPAGTLCGAGRSPICQAPTPACTVGQTMCTGTGATATLRSCLNGAWQTSLCPNGCAGTVCAPMGATGTVTGVVSYEQRLPRTDRSDWDAVSTTVAKGVLVTYLQGSVEVARTTTDMTGRFTLMLPTTAGASDRLLVTPYAYDPATNAPLYGVGRPTFPSGTRNDTRAPELANAGLWQWQAPARPASGDWNVTIHEADGSGALFIFERLRRIWEYNLTAFPGRPRGSIVAWMGLGQMWSCGACAGLGEITLGGYHFGTQLWMPGDDANRQYYADSVLGHELGHITMDLYGVNPDESGQHWAGTAVGAGMAWSEGFASYYGQDRLDNPLVIDKQGGSMSTGNLDLRLHGYGLSYLRPNPSSAPTQLLDEKEVSTILWRMRATLMVPDRQDLLRTLMSPRIASPTFDPTRGPLQARNSYRCYTRHQWSLNPTTHAPMNLCYVRDQYVTTLPDFLDAYVCAAAAGTARSARQAMITTAMQWPQVVGGVLQTALQTERAGLPDGGTRTVNTGLPYDPATADCSLTALPTTCRPPTGEVACP